MFISINKINILLGTQYNITKTQGQSFRQAQIAYSRRCGKSSIKEWKEYVRTYISKKNNNNSLYANGAETSFCQQRSA